MRQPKLIFITIVIFSSFLSFAFCETITLYHLLGQNALAKETLTKAKELLIAQNDYLKASDIEEFLGKLKP